MVPESKRWRRQRGAAVVRMLKMHQVPTGFLYTKNGACLQGYWCSQPTLTKPTLWVEKQNQGEELIYSAGAFGPWRDLCAWASDKRFWRCRSWFLPFSRVLLFSRLRHIIASTEHNWTILTNFTLGSKANLWPSEHCFCMNLDGVFMCGGQR